MSKNTSPDSFGFHPHRIILYLLIGTMSALFLSFTFAYVYTRIQHQVPPVKIPVIFIFNSIILVGASISLHFATQHFKTDQTNQYKHCLLITILLTMFFLIGQVLGWSQLLRQELGANLQNGLSYLYLISGLHFVHVLFGLPFIILFYLQLLRKTQDPVNTLLYFADPEKKLMLHIITVYWHFMDILWIYLVTFFAVNYLL